MNLAELSAQSGVPARTIRFYIARELVTGPDVAGRAAAYGRPHLERLRAIRKMQERGLTLVEIARELAGRQASLPPPAACWSYPVSADVTVLVRAHAPPWRLKLVREVLEEMVARLGGEEES